MSGKSHAGYYWTPFQHYRTRWQPTSCYCTDTWTMRLFHHHGSSFFQTLYKTRANNVRRFSNLANSVPFWTKCKSLPIKTTHLFNLMANFLARVMNVTLVLCTATQPLYDDEKYFHTIRYGGTHGEEADSSNWCRKNGRNLIEQMSKMERMNPTN